MFILTWLLALIILISPLPLGSNRPASEAALMLASLLSFAGYNVYLLASRQAAAVSKMKMGTLLFPAALACLWAFAQTLNLPPTWAHPIWQGQNNSLHYTLSVDPSATLWGTLKWIAFGCLFITSAQISRTPDRAKTLLTILVTSSAAYALYALFIYITGNQQILWIQKEAYLDSLTGTFINRNAFADSVGMGLLACLAYLVRTIRHTLDNAPRLNKGHYLLKAMPSKGWGTLLILIILLICLLLSNSRAGLIATGIGFLIFTLGLLSTRQLPSKVLFGTSAALVLLVVLTFSFAGQAWLERLKVEQMIEDDRLKIWALSREMIEDYPVLGQGLNTFDQLYPVYRTADLNRIYIRAHSTYLELAAEIGLPATLLFCLTFLLIGGQLLHGILNRRQNVIYPLLGLAILTQTAAHSLVDFSFQTPANTAWLMVILGIGIAQSYSSQEKT